MSQPYAYENRQGIHPISWNDFHGLCKGLVQAAAPFAPEIILAVGRGGYYPGTLIAHILRADIYPIRLSRRVDDVPVYQSPQWIVKHEAEKMGASQVRTAVLYAHTHGAHISNYIGLISDELLLNPWDREIFQDDSFQFNPEYQQALAQQGIQADPSLLIPANTIRPAKG
jgi:hypothetical protein